MLGRAVNNELNGAEDAQQRLAATGCLRFFVWRLRAAASRSPLCRDVQVLTPACPVPKAPIVGGRFAPGP